jgi:hypothetical protein
MKSSASDTKIKSLRENYPASTRRQAKIEEQFFRNYNPSFLRVSLNLCKIKGKILKG